MPDTERCPLCGPGYWYGDDGCRHTPPVTACGRTGDDTEALAEVLAERMDLGTSGRWIAHYGETPETLAAAVAAAARAEAVAGVQALADDFHERAQNFTNQTDIARACRAGWLAAARDLRAAVAPPTDTEEGDRG